MGVRIDAPIGPFNPRVWRGMKEITIRRPIEWRSAQATHVGKVREMNEDSILSLPGVPLWVVADGMGGYEAGNLASNMVVKSLEGMQQQATLNRQVNSIEDCLLDVNQRILEYGDIMLDGRTLGSTVVTLLIRGRVGVCQWAGDSRLYRYRNGGLVQLSRDHSQIEEQVQRGILSPEQAENHPEANVITRAVGADEQLFVDINVFSTQMGDVFLLCSDGLYNLLGDDEIAECLASYSIEQAVQVLLDIALERGADDNVSLILVKGEKSATSKRTDS